MDWFTVASFLLGAAVGAAVMYLLRYRFGDAHALQRRLKELEAESQTYRAQVDEHFERTSDLFQEVTEKYRDLHDHLAQGATSLTRGAERLPSIELPAKALLEKERSPDAAMERSDDLADLAEPPQTPPEIASDEHRDLTGASPAPEISDEVAAGDEAAIAETEQAVRR